MVVPNPSGIAIGPPEPRSVSSVSRLVLLNGLKKSWETRLPSELT